MNNRKDIIPNNLKEYRLKAGFTQKEVASILGFATEERISVWEKGKNIPNLINLLKLSSVYKATPMQMYVDLRAQVDEELDENEIKYSCRKD